MSRLDYCKYQLVDDCYDWKNDHCDGCNIFRAYCEGARMTKVSIVRCKDCEYADFKSPYPVCNLIEMNITDNDFCSWGERREE